MSLRSLSRKDSSRGETQDLRERQKSSLGREAVCRKWNGEFLSEYFNRNKWTTSRGNPEHCGQQKLKGAFPIWIPTEISRSFGIMEITPTVRSHIVGLLKCVPKLSLYISVRLICFESRVVSWRTSRDFTLLNIFDCTDSMNSNYFL